MRLFVLITTSVASLLILQSCSKNPVVPIVNENISTESILSKQTVPIITYAGDVKTSGWKTYRNENLGIELKHPSTFVIDESNTGKVIIRRDGATISDVITLKKVHSTLKQQVAEQFYRSNTIAHEGLAFKSKEVRAAIVRYQSGDIGSWFMTYFIVPESQYPAFPDFTEKANAYDIIVADVEAYPSEAELKQASEMNLQSLMLSQPQQILSTLNFYK